ncbi:hypothetical protein [Sporosarcina ureae]|uniref:hypothetical protein n=1 Tax=Sporosarcina ureae TaxID=1571 RepID=UPI000A17DF36|nr:hypothetical protein [Sporosarcina ureae]ARK21363.1 hypothetical protein SporoP32a_07345 [Sporosarcina ureae]
MVKGEEFQYRSGNAVRTSYAKPYDVPLISNLPRDEITCAFCRRDLTNTVQYFIISVYERPNVYEDKTVCLSCQQGKPSTPEPTNNTPTHLKGE